MGVSGGAGAFSLVLHTWTQDLQLHLHVHVVMACGVLDPQGQWHRPARKPDFLFPVQALSKVFRGKFMATLAQAHSSGQIAFDPQRSEPAWSQRQKQLYKHDGVVYAKTPLGGPAQVLEYLSRCTHRKAISNEHIRWISDSQVAFAVRADNSPIHPRQLTQLAQRSFQPIFLSYPEAALLGIGVLVLDLVKTVLAVRPVTVELPNLCQLMLGIGHQYRILPALDGFVFIHEVQVDLSFLCLAFLLQHLCNQRSNNPLASKNSAKNAS